MHDFMTIWSSISLITKLVYTAPTSHTSKKLKKRLTEELEKEIYNQES